MDDGDGPNRTLGEISRRCTAARHSGLSLRLHSQKTAKLLLGGTKRPFDPARRIAPKIKKAAFEAGLICYPMSGTRDGRQGDHILLAPPFIISQPQITEVVDKLDLAITQALATV